ncbi:helix-turn-helix transcriptional regulator [Kribbella sp. NPDC003505]|uniref:helix-turn-helix transcriptional regulator n=1 Tax=Kribbella sp. NPDC003505 TaxID=3154448 RepID=UPI0033BAEBA7
MGPAAALDGRSAESRRCWRDSDPALVSHRSRCGEGKGVALAPSSLSPQLSARQGLRRAVRELRTWRGLSQADLGALVFVSKDQIGKVEKALRWPSPELISGAGRDA